MGDWGRLTFSEGAALGNDDRSRARVVAPETADIGRDGTVAGPGWTMQLEPGWQLVAGERPGDFRLVPAAPDN